jgi:4-hydroxybenzoate polyprenyltransferase
LLGFFTPQKNPPYDRDVGWVQLAAELSNPTTSEHEMKTNSRFENYTALIRLGKPIGSLLILWPVLSALLIASHGHPSAANIFIFTCGVFLVRSAGCILNDIADRKIDKHVARTKLRPITSGKISIRNAIIFCGILLAAAFFLVLLTNEKTIFLSFVALALAAIYPLMKRFTHLPQVWLGFTFNWGVLMAFTATSNTIPAVAWWLYLSTIFSTIAYDTFYGMVDRKDDLKIGVKSTAILFGKKDRLITFVFQILSLGILWMIGAYAHFNAWFYLGLLAALLLITYQQILIRNREPEACFKAFLNNNYLWAFVFFGLVLNYLK